jgi:UDP-N-acetylglucosamine 2-epimerase (non-hydrolysing)
MKIMTVLGTRPEIIRLSQIIPKLDRLAEHVLVHTGQNFEPSLSEDFFGELGLRTPNYHLGIHSSSFGEQVGQILAAVAGVMTKEKPDRLLILGDTNSGLASIAAARMGVRVFHLEAGNRCYDRRVPEELNRRIIDHSSDILLPYTHRSKENLLREGIARDRIFVVGNPIAEVLEANSGTIEASRALDRHAVKPGAYLLATLHRAENVDEPERLASLLEGMSRVAESLAMPLLVSLHPRTSDRMKAFGVVPSSARVQLLRPMGFTDFVRLEREARLVLTDSGTVQEECCIFKVPNVTLRDVTERAETIEAGSNILAGALPSSIAQAVEVALAMDHKWTPPVEYMEKRVSETVMKVVMGHGASQEGF